MEACLEGSTGNVVKTCSTSLVSRELRGILSSDIRIFSVAGNFLWILRIKRNIIGLEDETMLLSFVT